MVLAEQILLIKINFTSFEIIPVYRELSITDHMVQFYYDQCFDKFLFILRCTQENGADLYKFQIYDNQEAVMEYESQLDDEKLIGRLCVG